MERLTIFTPTFNRAEKLKELYESLHSQTNKEFQWMIVDDGSTDQTSDLVESWIRDGKIKIKYLYQQNSGKCAALKYGIELCDTKWIICVDSDDTLSKIAVQSMIDDIKDRSCPSCLGYIYPRQMEESPTKWVPDGIGAINIMDTKYLYGIKETAILLRTEFLRKVEIPHFPGETFLNEGIIYIRLAEYGKIEPRNKVFYFAQYQQDGLTRNLFRLWIKNPNGTICSLKARYNFFRGYPITVRLKERIKCILNLNAVCMKSKKSIFKNTPSKFFSTILFLPSVMWKKIRFR